MSACGVLTYPSITRYWTVPLILDHSYLVGKLTSSKIADTKVVRVLEVLKLLFQQFLNLPSSQRDMSGSILGDLSNNRWFGGTSTRLEVPENACNLTINLRYNQTGEGVFPRWIEFRPALSRFVSRHRRASCADASVYDRVYHENSTMAMVDSSFLSLGFRYREPRYTVCPWTVDGSLINF